MKLTHLLMIAVATVALGACGQKNESAGEKIGSAVDDALDQRPAEELRDAAEDAGDAVEDAAKDVKEAAQDAAGEVKDAAEAAGEKIDETMEEVRN